MPDTRNDDKIVIDPECAITKEVAVVGFNKGQIGIYFPKVFIENGMKLGDTIELLMDKRSKAVGFIYKEDQPTPLKIVATS
jgi:hypothetical protein